MTELQGIQKQARIRYILAFIFAIVCLALLIFASWRMYTVFMTFKMFWESLCFFQTSRRWENLSGVFCV